MVEIHCTLKGSLTEHYSPQRPQYHLTELRGRRGGRREMICYFAFR